MKLHVGCGPWPIEGWVNVDKNAVHPGVCEVDATGPLPYKDSSVDYVFSEHFIEHLTRDEAQYFLRECYRCLSYGGKIRIATPDIAFLRDLLNDNLTELQLNYVAWANRHFVGEFTPQPASVVNNFFKAWDHKFIWGRKMLHDTLASIGYLNICQYYVGKSFDPNLHGLEQHGRSIPAEFNQLETMIFEAVK